MSDKSKRILKKSILPAILAILYIAAIAVLAYFADRVTRIIRTFGLFLSFAHIISTILKIGISISCSRVSKKLEYSYVPFGVIIVIGAFVYFWTALTISTQKSSLLMFSITLSIKS